MIAGHIADRGSAHVFAVHSDRRSIVNRRQERAGVHRVLCGVEADEAGQILILSAKTIGDPRTHARGFFACHNTGSQ